MTLYRIEVKICGTAYIKAESPEAAMEVANQSLSDRGFVVCEDPVDEDAFVSELEYDDPRLPNVSLSPYMTVKGAWPLGCVEEAE